MKELSIEEKAKRYDEALERARKINSGEGVEAPPDWTTCEVIFPELKESEDEKVRKKLINLVKKSYEQGGYALHKWEADEMLAWLEKQGEQKSVDKVEPKFKVGDKVYALRDRFECTIESIDELTYYGDTTNFDIKDQDNWKLVEQKPTDKVEPKFHKGEWITNGDYTWKIVEVKPLDYILKSQDGNIVDDTISHVDEQFHSFTIQDAKDGDVLVNWNNTVFIFKTVEDETVKFHIAYNEKWDEIKTPSTKFSHLGLPESQFEFHPATKEQRDLLFQKMKEAGCSL